MSTTNLKTSIICALTLEVTDKKRSRKRASPLKRIFMIRQPIFRERNRKRRLERNDHRRSDTKNHRQPGAFLSLIVKPTRLCQHKRTEVLISTPILTRHWWMIVSCINHRSKILVGRAMWLPTHHSSCDSTEVKSAIRLVTIFCEKTKNYELFKFSLPSIARRRSIRAP